MELGRLTLRPIQARPVVLKLKRPILARIATITDWPLIHARFGFGSPMFAANIL